MLITADQIVCHLLGDFFLQSDWMAQNKYSKLWVAFIHALFYTIPFLLLTRSWQALAAICVTHALIDHFKVANYLSWAKNWIALKRPKSWEECKQTGYDPERPLWISVWLGIIMDNTLHIIINGLSLRYLT